jgi:hypothetical protein
MSAISRCVQSSSRSLESIVSCAANAQKLLLFFAVHVMDAPRASLNMFQRL